MSMYEWAKKEIFLAIKELKKKGSNDDTAYMNLCYLSALDAFQCLMKTGHSGMSINVTKQVLNRLIEGCPLTPLTDDDFVLSNEFSDGTICYQNARMSSLFKYVYPDGKTSYRDSDRIKVFDIDSPNCLYYSPLVADIIDEMFPITMPYLPTSNKYMVACDTFLTDEANGDFDTKGISYVITPEGEKIAIERYFAKIDKKFVEIDKDEYIVRKNMRLKR